MPHIEDKILESLTEAIQAHLPENQPYVLVTGQEPQEGEDQIDIDFLSNVGSQGASQMLKDVCRVLDGIGRDESPPPIQYAG